MSNAQQAAPAPAPTPQEDEEYGDALATLRALSAEKDRLEKQLQDVLSMSANMEAPPQSAEAVAQDLAAVSAGRDLQEAAIAQVQAEDNSESAAEQNHVQSLMSANKDDLAAMLDGSGEEELLQMM